MNYPVRNYSNPLYGSEGGAPSESEYGHTFEGDINEPVFAQTLLPYESGMYPWLWGYEYIETPDNVPLPYYTDAWPGPLSLDNQFPEAQ